jgi:hypothetical protein
MNKIKPIDIKGRVILKGDFVRIIKIPEDVLQPQSPKDTKQIFKKALGKTFRVEGFGKYGHIELQVGKKLKPRTFDVIWIEPYCVSISRSMTNKNL